MQINIPSDVEQSVDQWRGSQCAACQQPSSQRFCSEECRRQWLQAYKDWLKSEGKYQPNQLS